MLRENNVANYYTYIYIYTYMNIYIYIYTHNTHTHIYKSARKPHTTHTNVYKRYLFLEFTAQFLDRWFS